MARYIDADALGIGRADRNAFEIPEYADGWNGAIEIIANAPTADVVPKSEVIEIENKLRPLEDKLMRYEQVCGKLIIKDGVGIGLLPDGKETVYILKSIASVTKELAIKRTKQEVAREIFEEMFEKLNHIVITADVCVEYNTFMKTIKQVCAAVSAELAELKKKYTEEKE